jgi:hypothetical protein
VSDGGAGAVSFVIDGVTGTAVGSVTEVSDDGVNWRSFSPGRHRFRRQTTEFRWNVPKCPCDCDESKHLREALGRIRRVDLWAPAREVMSAIRNIATAAMNLEPLP